MIQPIEPRKFGVDGATEGLPFKRTLPFDQVYPAPPPSAPVQPAPTKPPAAEPQPTPQVRPSPFGVRRSDQLLMGGFVVVLLALMACHWVRLSGWGMRPVEIERLPSRTFDYKIDLNTAPWVELALLEGVGETLARRIVADREQNGPFRSIDDVDRVKGIGPKTLERLRPFVTVGSADSAQTHRQR